MRENFAIFLGKMSRILFQEDVQRGEHLFLVKYICLIIRHGTAYFPTPPQELDITLRDIYVEEMK